MAKWFGTNFPFYKGNNLLGVTAKVLPRQEDTRLINNDLIQGLMTIKGERWFRPTFGGSIPTFLFDPNDSVTYSQISGSINDFVSRFEPRINISKVDIQQNKSNPNVANVLLYGTYQLGATTKDTLIAQFQVSVAGLSNG
jgi:phage baseplate assembly protein W